MIKHLYHSWLALLLLVSCCTSAYSQWTDLNTGVSDDLTGVVFWGNAGATSGLDGIYYTTTGGVGPSSWTKFEITGNIADSVKYENTEFYHMYSVDYEYVFACGKNLVDDKAIVFQFHIPTQAYQILYEGSIGSKLNNIGYSYYSSEYYAVGDNGLLVRFENGVNGLVEPSGLAIDFTAVSFYNNKVSIGAQDYKITGDNNNPGLSLTAFATNGTSFTDVFRHANYSAYAVGDGFYSLNYGNGAVNEFTQYNFGPLNANCLWKNSSYTFIGTDHGIFVNGYSSATEYQASSLNHNIKEFWYVAGSEYYACGNNGVILHTLNNGAPPVPYTKVVENGGCSGQTLIINGYYGDGNTCDWYLDGSFVNSYCGSITANYATAGTHEVKLIVTGPGGTDSSIVVFEVVDTPAINLPYVLNDYILCKEEVVDIAIQNSENFVYYEFIDVATQTVYGTSAVGNGGNLNFTTNLISQGGPFIVKAKSSLAECNTEFTDTTYLVVEHTKADFHTGVLNAVPLEETYFYEKCSETQFYEWSFPAGSTFMTSALADPVNSFSNAGPQSIQLIASSANGCFDTIVKNGTAIFNEPAVYDSCFVNLSNGPDPQWQGYYYPDIYDMTEYKDGYLVSGTYHDQKFATTYGDSLYLDWFGSYLNYYDKNGVLKWNVHSIGAGSGVISSGNNYNKFRIESTDVDSEGNIIACGYFNDYFVDNRGDTITLPFGYGQVLKLDSLGRTIWVRSTSTLNPQHVKVDHSDNILVSGTRNHAFNAGIQLALNGVNTDTIDYVPDVNYGVTKFDKDGFLTWDMPIYINHVNSVKLLRPQVDDSNFVYLTGNSEHGITFFSTDDPVNGHFHNTFDGIYGQKLYHARFDSNGVYLWTVISKTYGTGSESTAPYGAETDADGNTYISGSNNCHVTGYGLYHYFENTDNTITSHEAGEYFVAKVNKQGICEWVNGAYSSYYGYGHEIDVVDDKVYVIGMVSLNGIQTCTVDFYNPDSSSISLTINNYDYFMATYDTSGVLHQLTMNANNSDYINSYGWHGFFKGTDGKFYAARTGNLYSSTLTYYDFGDSIEYTNSREGWITKFCENCGINYKAQFQNTIDTNVCVGSSYTFPGGNTVMNIQANMADTLILNSINLLDSIIITNLVVNGQTDVIDSVEICQYDSFTFMDGTTTDSVNTVITHLNSFQTLMGCDSLITQVVIPKPSYQIVDSVDHCPNQTYLFPDGNSVNSITGVYTHVSSLISSTSCDSTITTVLIPWPGYYVADSIYLCYGSSYSFLDGSTVTNITVNSSHLNTIPSLSGCDSLVTEVINVIGTAPTQINGNICQGENYTFLDGTVITNVTSPVTHDNYFTDVNGCDSIITENINVSSIDVTTGLNNGNEIFSIYTGTVSTNYQWVDCNNAFSSIPNETNYNFIVQNNGSYAVVIMDLGCADTSDCVTISDLGIVGGSMGYSIYPNPNRGQFAIDFTAPNSVAKIEVHDVLGKVLYINEEVQDQNLIQLENSDGIYFVVIYLVDGSSKTERITIE